MSLKTGLRNDLVTYVAYGNAVHVCPNARSMNIPSTVMSL